MSNPGTLVNGDEAVRYIDRIPDPVTRTLVNMAFVRVVARVHLERRDPPAGDFDLLFLATALADFFADHQVIARALEGETVGAWFDDGP